MAYAFCFQATDENGNRSAKDILFDNYLSKGIEFTLDGVCRFDLKKDRQIIWQVRDYYNYKKNE
jgi:mannitol-1-phosphate 5-dehydrogenase